MGTNGAFGFICNGKDYIIYNHWDSYPEYLGKIFLNFIKLVSSEQGWDNLRENCNKLECIDPNIKPTESLKQKYLKYANLKVGEQTLDDCYCLLRKLQNGNFLYEVYKGNVNHLVNRAKFLRDQWCEYGYVIDLDQFKAVFWKDGKKFAEKNLKTIRALPFDYKITEFFGRVPKSILISD